LLADSESSQKALIEAMLALAQAEEWSSLHLLFLSENDLKATDSAGWLSRHTVQFHWNNLQFQDFEHFLEQLNQVKRKKIRQERRKVQEAGVTFKTRVGSDIQSADWDFFYQCYSQTYYEHGNAPYLSRDFFQRMQDTMPQHWVLFVAERNGQRIACSLIGVDTKVAYGRYWGALERVDCLHFEACYYQPIQWCIANHIQRFEGGAQGEHKMARALLPVKASSAHWLAHSGFADETGTGAGEGATYNQPLPVGTGWREYSHALDRAFDRLSKFDPSYLVVSQGFDTFAGDRWGGFELHAPDYARIGERLRAFGRPIVVILEGGYEPANIAAGTMSLLDGLG
jgi:hypothetical protein